MRCSWPQTFGFKSCIDTGKLFTINLLTIQEGAISSVFNLDLLQHLANDHFNMLVIDFHTLQPVHILNFLNEIFSKRFYSKNAENVMWHGATI